jgi:hypothetical protein
MVDKPTSGKLFGVPYNFERPSMKRMLEAYWQPGEELLVEKPFGVGYSLNLANWRSWIVIAIAAVLLWRERSSEAEPEPDEEAVEVVIDD